MPKKKKEATSKTTKAKPKKWGAAAEKKEDRAEREIIIEEETLEELKAEVPKMKMITPSIIAQKYNIRISVVKQIINELLEEKKIKTLIHSSRLKVFVPA